MALVICRQDTKIQQWKKALKTAAPDIEVYSCLEDHPKEKVKMALVWKHPPGSLKEYPNLECIASSGAGVDFIFADKEAPKNIPITRVVDPMLASDMSEHVTALIFVYLKNLNQYKLDQTQQVWNPLPYARIKDFTIGILGLGALGALLATNLVHIGFQVQGWSQSKKVLPSVTAYTGKTGLPGFLSSTDILVCLLPLTPDTVGILNNELFAQLPKGAYVINVARGGHLVDEDLLKALKANHLSGAALDVFHEEPLDREHPFWSHSKVHISPHCASVSDTKSVVPQIIENYRNLYSGKSLKNIVSMDRGY